MNALPPNPRIVLAGSVGSSRRTVEALVRNGCNLVGVLGLSPEASANVSGYVDLVAWARENDVEAVGFTRINDDAVVETVRQWAPDLLFIVGISQLVHAPLIATARHGCVGFHPTRLPEGRGRAPVAWLTLDVEDGASTFFLLNEGVDAGPILVQEPFAVAEGDDAGDVVETLEAAIDRGLDRWLPRLREGVLEATPQDEARATYNGRRSPEDGLLDWSRPAAELARLVRAAARPHPGAFTYSEGERIVVWQAEPAPDCPYRGVVGRVLTTEASGAALVQTGDGVLRLNEWAAAETGETPPLRVGRRLGIEPQTEIAALRTLVESLTERVRALEARA